MIYLTSCVQGSLTIKTIKMPDRIKGRTADINVVIIGGEDKRRDDAVGSVMLLKLVLVMFIKLK